MMERMFHLIVEDRRHPESGARWVETFQVAAAVKDPLGALKEAVRDFCTSGGGGTEDGSGFHWGDAMLFVPDNFFARYGMTRQRFDAADAFVDHDEVLWRPILREEDTEHEKAC